MFYILPTYSANSANSVSHQPKQNQADGGTAQFKVKPTQLSEELDHPVQSYIRILTKPSVWIAPKLLSRELIHDSQVVIHDSSSPSTQATAASSGRRPPLPRRRCRSSLRWWWWGRRPRRPTLLYSSRWRRTSRRISTLVEAAGKTCSGGLLQFTSCDTDGTGWKVVR